MPFTLAHPAAVLPLLRPPFSALALVAGAVAPDVPYFVRAAPVTVTAQTWYEPFTNATTSHTPSGVTVVDLPIAALLYAGLLLAVPPARTLLPDAATPDPHGHARTRRAAPRNTPAGVLLRCTWVVASLLVGVLTHLVWDSFTHADGYVVTHVEQLGASAVADVSWARLLQHASTALGLLVLAAAVWRHRRRIVGAAGSSARRRLLTATGACATAAPVGVVVATRSGLDPSPTLDTRAVVEGLLADAALGAGLGVAACVTLGTAAWWAVLPLRTALRRRAGVREHADHPG